MWDYFHVCFERLFVYCLVSAVSFLVSTAWTPVTFLAIVIISFIVHFVTEGHCLESC